MSPATGAEAFAAALFELDAELDWALLGREYCSEGGYKPRELFTVLRVATTGRTAAPPLFDTMAIAGKDRVRARVRDVIELLKKTPDW